MPRQSIEMFCPKPTKTSAEEARIDLLHRGYECTEVMPIPEEIESVYGEGWYFKTYKPRG